MFSDVAPGHSVKLLLDCATIRKKTILKGPPAVIGMLSVDEAARLVQNGLRSLLRAFLLNALVVDAPG